LPAPNPKGEHRITTTRDPFAGEHRTTTAPNPLADLEPAAATTIQVTHTSGPVVARVTAHCLDCGWRLTLDCTEAPDELAEDLPTVTPSAQRTRSTST
jgi:hypothetical protein